MLPPNQTGVCDDGSMPEEELLRIELTDRERVLLRAGLLEWTGPARPSEPLAIAMGFDGLEGLRADVKRLRMALEDDDELSRADWQRVLIATEIVFVSDVVGSGLDWRLTTGVPDAEAIELLRGLQRKLPRWRVTFQFTMSDEQVVIENSDRSS